MASSPWDLSALVNAAQPQAGQAERHLWLVRLMEWLRHAPEAAGEAQVEAFIDRVAQLIRSQSAGILGNLVLCGPLVLAVLAVQSGWQVLFGETLVGQAEGGRCCTR